MSSNAGLSQRKRERHATQQRTLTMAAPKQGKLYRAIKPGKCWTYNPQLEDRGHDGNWDVLKCYNVGCYFLFLGASSEVLSYFIGDTEKVLCQKTYEFLTPHGEVCRLYYSSDDEFERWFEPAET